jgi:8-oxo-dGTP diphosphatase
MKSMISQALIINDGKVLMVRQYVQRGDLVWNFPGGGIEEGESPEEACIMEVKEETGYDVELLNQIHVKDMKYTYIAKIVGGTEGTDYNVKGNEDIIEIAWKSLKDIEIFDTYTRPIIEQFVSQIEEVPNIT